MNQSIRVLIGLPLVLQPLLVAVLFSLGLQLAAALFTLAFVCNLTVAGLYHHHNRGRGRGRAGRRHWPPGR